MLFKGNAGPLSWIMSAETGALGGFVPTRGGSVNPTQLQAMWNRVMPIGTFPEEHHLKATDVAFMMSAGVSLVVVWCGNDFVLKGPAGFKTPAVLR